MRIYLFAMICMAAVMTQSWAAEDVSPHKIKFITVEKDVQLEVLDWGGDGQSIVFLSGLGDTGHAFDAFAPKFTNKHHVYSITRRGFGASSKPSPTRENYDADRLADDVLTVLDELRLQRPILVGHSIAGNELSSIGGRHPEKVAALIYLDATDGVGFYSTESPVTVRIDAAVVQRALDELPFASSARKRELTKELEKILPQFEKSLQWSADSAQGIEWPTYEKTPDALIVETVRQGARMYSSIHAPALVIIAFPWACPSPCPVGRKANDEGRAKMVDAVRAGWPEAKVVTIPNSRHDVYRFNEAEVFREMNTFMNRLK
jgi:non-heme chloroperoxidase